MRYRTLVLVSLGLWVLIALTACGSWHFPTFGLGDGAGSGGQPVPPPRGGILGSKDELARLLEQLKWLFIGLGILAFVASFWIPLISTRHAVGSLIFGIIIAVAKPIILLLYWPTVIALGCAAIAAAWPYAIAAYAWFQSRFRGKQLPTPTVGVVASLKSLVMPRAVAAGARFPDVPDGPGDFGSNPMAK